MCKIANGMVGRDAMEATAEFREDRDARRPFVFCRVARRGKEIGRAPRSNRQVNYELRRRTGAFHTRRDWPAPKKTHRQAPPFSPR
jgi:hypothetical protein